MTNTIHHGLLPGLRAAMAESHLGRPCPQQAVTVRSTVVRPHQLQPQRCVVFCVVGRHTWDLFWQHPPSVVDSFSDL